MSQPTFVLTCAKHANQLIAVTVRRAIAAGYDSHVAKPVDTEELIRAIARVIKTARV